MAKSKKVKEIVIKIGLLERIAEFYEFPFAVFFGDEKMFKAKTRVKSILKRNREFKEKLIELIDEYFH